MKGTPWNYIMLTAQWSTWALSSGPRGLRLSFPFFLLQTGLSNFLAGPASMTFEHDRLGTLLTLSSIWILGSWPENLWSCCGGQCQYSVPIWHQLRQWLQQKEASSGSCKPGMFFVSHLGTVWPWGSLFHLSESHGFYLSSGHNGNFMSK